MSPQGIDTWILDTWSANKYILDVIKSPNTWVLKHIAYILLICNIYIYIYIPPGIPVYEMCRDGEPGRIAGTRRASDTIHTQSGV